MQFSKAAYAAQPMPPTTSISSAPNCPNDRMLRILDYRFTKDEKGNNYNDTCKRKAARSFIIAFDITCEECGFHDCVKVSNIGWQGGGHSVALRK